MATGHYVRRTEGRDGPQLRRAVDAARDQSYFLFATTATQLEYLRFPLGGLEKPEVRRVAAELGLAAADKPDSQDICFVPEGRYTTVIDRLRPQGAIPGDILHMDGRVLGRHEGVTRYTVGQRRGLNIAVGEPLFVVRLDADRRQVIVGPREALLTAALSLKETNWLGEGADMTAAGCAGRPVLARVRSTREPVAARLAARDGAVSVVFEAPEDGVSPGQACVLYAPEDPDRVLGGGFIAATQAASPTLAGVVSGEAET
jgi:tRNA-specific 2-thiouridylase